MNQPKILKELVNKVNNHKKQMIMPLQQELEEIVVNQDKKIEWIKLKIDEEIQKELIKQSLSDKTSDRDTFVSGNEGINYKLRLLYKVKIEAKVIG